MHSDPEAGAEVTEKDIEDASKYSTYAWTCFLHRVLD